MSHYTPPKIGFDAETAKRLDAMRWPNALLGASDGEIALAYKAHQDAARTDTRLAVWTVWSCLIGFAGMCAYLWLGVA